MEIYFSIYRLLPVVWAMAGLTAAVLLWLLWPYRCRVRRVARQAIEDTAEVDKMFESPLSPSALPEVSVIVYARDEARSLQRLLPSLLSQEYPSDTEVIVVNDGGDEDVTTVVNRLAAEHKNLYLTFVPPEARNLSRKKLALSLGIKAAKKDFVVLTCANCRVPSPRWLAAMCRHFAQGKEVVIGRSVVKGLRRRKLRFDQAATLVTYLYPAIKGHPYRGTGYNLAYSRRLFFDSRGFSKTLNLHNGDDDLFVHQIANGDNTAVELSRYALVTVEFHEPSKKYREMRYAHEFTARKLPRGSRRFFGFSTWTMWTWVAATAVGVVFSLPNALPACWFAATIPALWVPLTLAWRRTERALGIRPGGGLLWWMMLWRWTFTLRCRLRCASDKRRNFTWNNKD